MQWDIQFPIILSSLNLEHTQKVTLYTHQPLPCIHVATRLGGCFCYIPLEPGMVGLRIIPLSTHL